MLSKEKIKKIIKSHSWHHDFEIIPGFRTNGSYNPSWLWNELQLPEDMTNMSLADIGASNGYFSFEARKRGAVVEAFDFRHKDNSGFGLAQYINGLNDIKHHHINVIDINPKDFGKFDIVLSLGILYHVSDPYLVLKNCASLAKDRLLVESYCIDHLMPQPLCSEPIMRFISDPVRFPDQGQPNKDRTNFWGFTSMCIHRMLEDLGFEIQRKYIRGDRVVIDSKRILFEEALTRLHIAYSIFPRIINKANDIWQIF